MGAVVPFFITNSVHSFQKLSEILGIGMCGRVSAVVVSDDVVLSAKSWDDLPLTLEQFPVECEAVGKRTE